MKDFYIKIGNREIHYYDNEKSGLPVFLIHGNSLNAHFFYHQFSEIDEIRLIAPDLPGHGKSFISDHRERDYGVKAYIELLEKFISQFNFSEFAIFGHSLGGHISIHLSKLLPCLKGLALMGTPPLTLPPQMEKAFLPHPALGLAFRSELSEEEMHQLAASFIEKEHKDYPLFYQSIHGCDSRLRAAVGDSLATDLDEDEAEILKSASFPVAIFHGEKDLLVNADYIRDLNLNLFGEKVEIIKAGGHSAFVDAPESFNGAFTDFLNSL